jgi:hypothetical protein
MSAKAPRAWQRMLSGRRLDLLDPSPLDIEIEDIAHGLARVARWNGQTIGDHIFSVAQHSLLVEGIAAEQHPELPAASRLTILLHDAAEYVLGDVISPFKAVIGEDLQGGRGAPRERDLPALRPAGRAPGRAEAHHQARRPPRRLSRSHALGGLRTRGGAQVLRQTRSPPGPARRLPRAMADRHGASALSRALPWAERKSIHA